MMPVERPPGFVRGLNFRAHLKACPNVRDDCGRNLFQGRKIAKTLKTLQENHETQCVLIRSGVALCQTLLYFGWRERML